MGNLKENANHNKNKANKTCKQYDVLTCYGILFSLLPLVRVIIFPHSSLPTICGYKQMQ
jgi:hypothetical protein